MSIASWINRARLAICLALTLEEKTQCTHSHSSPVLRLLAFSFKLALLFMVTAVLGRR